MLAAAEASAAAVVGPVTIYPLKPGLMTGEP